MKTITGSRATFPSLILAFYMLAFGGNVVAQILPSATELLARATAKSYPRTIDVAALKSGVDYEGRWTAVQYAVTQQYAQILSPEPLTANARLVAQAEGAKTTLAAAVWLRTGSPAAASEAKRRALNIASWSPTGTTGYLSNDQAGRHVARTLALAYDWLYGQWTPDEIIKLQAAIRPRVVDILSNAKPYGLNNGLTLDTDIYNGHAANTAGFVSVVCTVLAGKELLYDQCLVDIVPRYLSKPTVWGGNDGGFANGTAYAHWALLSSEFLHWPLLKQAVGVDMWQTLWTQGYGNYIAYFLPPGAPSGVFGDETEIKYGGVWATQGKAYAGYLPSPLANWYARNQSGEYKDDPALLLAPQQNMSVIPTTLPSGTPHGIHIPSIGWVAMHSDLGNPLRNSVYFKSSPYGSFNHSHSDQNSFVIHAGGQSLAIDSGYYDDYGTPHWKGWYKTTRAHNAITFDGGQGQMYETMAAKGKITQFGNTTAYDLVTGDATVAYGGTLTKAVRSMVYLRPNTLVVFDSLASATPRTWEWNIHSLSQMTPDPLNPSRNIKINQGGTLLCVRQVTGPGVAFNQTNLFTVAPTGTRPAQWHGTFSSLVKSTTALFVTVLEVGCGNTPLTVAGTSDSRTVTILGKNLNFNVNAVTVSTVPVSAPKITGTSQKK